MFPPLTTHTKYTSNITLHFATLTSLKKTLSSPKYIAGMLHTATHTATHTAAYTAATTAAHTATHDAKRTVTLHKLTMVNPCHSSKA